MGVDHQQWVPLTLCCEKGKTMKTNHYDESDPRYHAVNIQRMLDDVLTHCREDAEK